MLGFPKRIEAVSLPVQANIGFLDDGSPEAGEVMNLFIRRNLLFRIVAAPDTRLDLNVRLGSPVYPRAAASNPSEFPAMVRPELSGQHRLRRVYGSDVELRRL